MEDLLELDGREVKRSSPGKVLFREHGETKRDLVDYYRRVREPLLRTMPIAASSTVAIAM